MVLLDKAETLKSTSQQVSVASQGHLSFSCDPIHPLLRHVDSIVTKQMNEYALDVRTAQGKARPQPRPTSAVASYHAYRASSSAYLLTGHFVLHHLTLLHDE